MYTCRPYRLAGFAVEENLSFDNDWFKFLLRTAENRFIISWLDDISDSALQCGIEFVFSQIILYLSFKQTLKAMLCKSSKDVQLLIQIFDFSILYC